MADEITWLPPIEPTKSSLIAGIKAKIREQTGLEHLDFAFLDRTATDDLLVLALTMGFRHELSMSRLRQADQWQKEQRSREQAKGQELSRRAEARRAVVGSLSAEMTEAALGVITESLLGATDLEIMQQAAARGLDPTALVLRVARMKADRAKPDDNPD